MSLVVYLLLIHSVFAEDFLERVYEGFSDKPSLNEARSEIYRKGTEEIAKEVIVQFIGEEKFQRNFSRVKSRVIDEYSKFIPYIKPGAPRLKEGRTEMTIHMRISTKNLRDLLLQNGLLYQDDGLPVIIPMIQLVDRSRLKNYKWWLSEIEDPTVLRFVDTLTDKMREAFYRRGFYLINPTRYGMHAVIPEAFRFDRPRTQDWQTYGRIFGAQIVVNGGVEVSRSSTGEARINVRLSAIQTANGRVIASVTRAFPVKPGPFALANSMKEWAPKVSSDMAIQILEAWQRGTFGAQLLTLQINRKLNYDEMRAFKDKLKAKSKSVKSIKERLFDPNYVRIEVDVTTPPSKFVGVFEEFDFYGLKTEVESFDSKVVYLNVKPSH